MFFFFQFLQVNCVSMHFMFCRNCIRFVRYKNFAMKNSISINEKKTQYGFMNNKNLLFSPNKN